MESNIRTNNETNIKRCDICSSLLCFFIYKHNGIEKKAYRCPSPHGLKSLVKKQEEEQIEEEVE